MTDDVVSVELMMALLVICAVYLVVDVMRTMVGRYAPRCSSCDHAAHRGSYCHDSYDYGDLAECGCDALTDRSAG